MTEVVVMASDINNVCCLCMRHEDIMLLRFISGQLGLFTKSVLSSAVEVSFIVYCNIRFASCVPVPVHQKCMEIIFLEVTAI